jgi:predicted permease
MSLLTELRRRLSYLFGRSRFERELDAELQFHLETRAEELQATGLTRHAALAQARREFGSTARITEETRSAWQFRRLEDLAADLRYAARGLRRNRAFSLTAVACLALAIGANTTIFSITAEALFSRPSIRDPRSVVAIRLGGNSHATQGTWRFLRDARIFDGLAGENEEVETNWRRPGATERLSAVKVTANFFEVTGIPVAIGRPLANGESDAVVLSHGLWMRGFGGSPGAVGEKMILDGRVFTIAGVLPRDHRTVTGFGFSPELYVPVTDTNTVVALYARLPAGMNRAIARGRLESACRQFDPELARHIEINAVTGMERFSQGSQTLTVAAFFGMLLIVVGLVLLIACANVASMLLARAAGRGQEIAIRLSIGAGRGRLVRQLLAETLLLALCGTAAGLALNIALTTLLSRVRLVLPVPIQYQIRPDWRLLTYSTAVALGTCVAAGLVPALKATRIGIDAALKHDARQVGGRWTLRNALVVGQVAVSVVLLSAGLLFLRNLVSASTASPGFDLEHTLWGYMRLVPESYSDPAKTRAVVAAALDRLRALPGVDSATVARIVPLNDNFTMGIELRPDGANQPVHVRFRMNYVGADYFRVMQIPLRAGRAFEPSDRQVAIINENMARRLFGDRDPVGRTLRWEAGNIVVVGVARNSKYFTLGEENMSAYYAPYWEMPQPRSTLHFLVRAAGHPEPLVPAVASTLRALDPTAAIETKPMSKALVFALLPSRVGAAVLGSVGLLGLALASIGLYGALLYSVSRRMREIGLRVALGASPASVLRLVLTHSAGLAGAGIALGIALAVFAVRPLALFLTPEIHPGDPSTFVIVAVTLSAVAVAATVAPALRALRVDPLTALRHE